MENLMAMWDTVPTELKVLLVPVLIWAVDWVVTATPNPWDNMFWRWWKKKKITG